MKLLNKIIISIFLSISVASFANALCKPKSLEFITSLKNVCWDCIYPLKIAGVDTVRGNMHNEPTLTTANRYPVCTCVMPPPIFERVGVPIGYFDPVNMAEVVSDPYCFPMLGFDSGDGSNNSNNYGNNGNNSNNKKSANKGTLGGTQGAIMAQNGVSKKTFMQVHWWAYPVMEIIDMMVDSTCVQAGGIDLAFITEVDPIWQDDELSAIINPDAVLFGNPVANLSCVADSVAANISKYPLEFLYWCKGSWGNAYPLTGNTFSKSLVEDSASILSTFIYMGNRLSYIFNDFGPIATQGICQAWPSPIWFKNAYRLQLIYPISYQSATPIGVTDIIWGRGKNPPYAGDNFGYIIFKQKECCDG